MNFGSALEACRATDGARWKHKVWKTGAWRFGAEAPDSPDVTDDLQKLVKERGSWMRAVNALRT